MAQNESSLICLYVRQNRTALSIDAQTEYITPFPNPFGVIRKKRGTSRQNDGCDPRCVLNGITLL